jgi:hypothetical protein
MARHQFPFRSPIQDSQDPRDQQDLKDHQDQIRSLVLEKYLIQQNLVDLELYLQRQIVQMMKR